MRILWILPYSPWPTTSGGKTRQYHLLRSLAARGHRITVLLHSKQPVSAEDRQALEPFLERLVVLPRRPLRSLSTLLAALFAPYPLLASVNGLSAELQRTAKELLREPWDVVQVEHSYSFQPYERPLRDAGQPFVLTEHNVESSLGAATYDRLPGWALPFVRYDQWRYRRWERRVMSQAAAVVAVTEKDARQLGAMLGRPVPVVVNGVDCEHFAAARPTPEAQRVLFLGNYEYAPNVDAVEWMLDEILPRVWAHCPEARMSVCGYALPAEWAQRWSDPRIEWQGFVPDLLQLQSSSSVFLAALRHGGGSKLKVLSLAVVLFWMSLRKVPYTGRLLLLGVGLVVVLVLSYPPLQERLATIFSPQNASTEVRFDEYRMFPKAVARYPLGIGFKVDPPVPGTDLLGISNLWLNFMYKVGLGGMLLFIAVTWRWWREARPEKGPIRLTRDNAIWLGSTGGILAALVSGLFDHYFSFAVVMIGLFWLLVGINLLEARRLFPERQPQPRAVGYRKLKRQLERGAEA